MKYSYVTSRHNEKGTLFMDNPEIIKYYIKVYIPRIYNKSVADYMLKNPSGNIAEKVKCSLIGDYLDYINIIGESESTAVAYKFLLKKTDINEQLKAKAEFLLEETNQENVTSFISFFIMPASIENATVETLKNFHKKINLPEDKIIINLVEKNEDKNEGFILSFLFLKSL